MSRARYTWETTSETRELLTRVKEATGAPSLGETLRRALTHYAGTVGEGEGEMIPFYASPRVRSIIAIIAERWDADSPGEVIPRCLAATDTLTGAEERGERVVVIRTTGEMERFLTS